MRISVPHRYRVRALCRVAAPMAEDRCRMRHQTLFIVIAIVIIEALLHVIPVQVVRDIPVNISTPNQNHTYSSQDSNKRACTSNAPPQPR